MPSHIIILGATGMIGGLALRECLHRSDVRAVTVIGRRSAGVQHPKLTEILHQDLSDFSAIAAHFTDCDAALYCVGAYTGAVPDAEFRRVTVDMPVAFARALHAASPHATFCLLSGQGADPTGTSRVPFARYKGEAENALNAIGFPRVHSFRPGYIYPVTPRAEPNVAYRIMRALWPVARIVAPNLGIASDDLAWAMVEAALGTQPSSVLENREIRALASTRNAARSR